MLFLYNSRYIHMKFRSIIQRLFTQEDLNFLVTNRIPRRTATIFMGRFSKIKNPLVRTISIKTWQFFSGADLSDALKTNYESLHDAFIRELKPGARVVCDEPDVIVSPCDGIIGAHGAIDGTCVFQAKGFPYHLEDLLPTSALVDQFRNGSYITIRITAGMYHRFHAPLDCHINRVTYISGDTWNVNPIALKRVEQLFCKNERAVIESTHYRQDGRAVPFLMVPVAAILVASIRLHCIDMPLNLTYKGPNVLTTNYTAKKGDELGWFEHGSTIILFLPEQIRFATGIAENRPIRMGEPLIQLTETGR